MSDEKMLLYDDEEQFKEWNCVYCEHCQLPQERRPCNGQIPLTFNQTQWYPDECPFKVSRPLTDEERRELLKEIEYLFE